MKSIGTLWLAYIIRVLAALVAGILVVRHLGPDQYGILGVAGAWATLFAAFTTLPQNQLAIRELVKSPASAEHQEAVLATAFIVRLGGTIAQFVICASLVHFMGYSADVLAATALMSIAHIGAPFSVINSRLESDGKFDQVAKVELTTVVCSSIIRVALVAAGAPVLWFAAAMVLDALVQATLLVRLHRRFYTRWSSWRLSAALLPQWIRDGAPLALSGLMIAVYMRSDVLIIAHFLGKTEAGIYAAAVRIIEVLFFIPGVVITVLFPQLARAHGDSARNHYRIVMMAIGGAFWVGVFLAVGISFLSPLVFNYLLGAQFAAAVPIAVILAWAIPVVAFVSGLAASVTMTRSGLLVLYATAMAAAFNFTLNLCLVPTIGAGGAAIVAILTQLASALGMLWLARDPMLWIAAIKALSLSTPLRLSTSFLRRLVKQ